MIRVRFHTNESDPRPVNWPIVHPYWVTGYGEGYATVVAYVDDKAELLANWPDATDIDVHRDGPNCVYEYTDRFPKPTWMP